MELNNLKDLANPSPFLHCCYSETRHKKNSIRLSKQFSFLHALHAHQCYCEEVWNEDKAHCSVAR